MNAAVVDGRIRINGIGVSLQGMTMELPGKTGGCVQEIKHHRHHTSANKHGDGAEDPEEEREGEVESSQANRPEEAGSIQASSSILHGFPVSLGCRQGRQETDMGIVSN